MKLTLIFFSLVFNLNACVQENNTAKLKISIEDSIKNVNAEKRKRDSLIQKWADDTFKEPTAVYAFCVLYYESWHYGDASYKEENGIPVQIPPEIIIENKLVTSTIGNIENTEDAKYRFRDRFEFEWRKRMTSYELNRIRITRKEILTFRSYAAASEARDNLTMSLSK